MKLKGMTPEEWEEWYSAVKASMRADAVHDIMDGMWRASERRRSADKDGGATWTPADREESGDIFLGTPGLDVVKIVYEARFEEGMNPFRHGSAGVMRCYAEMWRGAQNVRKPIKVGKMEEFVTELKEEGFMEIRRQDCIHYLWRKRS